MSKKINKAVSDSDGSVTYCSSQAGLLSEDLQVQRTSSEEKADLVGGGGVSVAHPGKRGHL